MTEYISKEVAKRIIDSERSKEQMITMLENVPPADVVLKEKYDKLLKNAMILADAVHKYQKMFESKEEAADWFLEIVDEMLNEVGE